MDSINQGNNSETSSEENDQPEKVSKNDTMGTGRLYDCSFCKRGFTNAQALGGHMNIHRKDKAKLTKTKQAATSEASNSNKPSKEYVSSSYLSPFMGHQKPYYPVLGSHTSYESFSIQTPAGFSQAESDCVNANLSLGIGIPYVEENEDKNRGEKMDVDIVDDVDLELRLGQKP